MDIIEKLGITKSPWGHKLEKQNISGLADEGMDIFFETVVDSNSLNICRLQSKPTAQLIATAPEILEALIKLCERISYLESSVGCRQSLSLLKDVSLPIIQKATNKSWEQIKELM